MAEAVLDVEVNLQTSTDLVLPGYLVTGTGMVLPYTLDKDLCITLTLGGSSEATDGKLPVESLKIIW
jgi:hypothetical protein